MNRKIDFDCARSARLSDARCLTYRAEAEIDSRGGAGRCQAATYPGAMRSEQKMESGDETVIGLSKTKIVLVVLGACAFVAAGAWMFSLDDASIRSRRSFNDPLYVHGLGLGAVVFFGICGLFGLKKLFDRKPGLVFSESGIVDNASGVSAGFIPWSEVLGAEIFEIQKQKMLIIHVRNPQAYLARGGTLKRTLNKANYKMVGSPISISSNALALTFPELVSLFDRYYRTYCGGPRAAGAQPPPAGQDARSTVEPGSDAGLAADPAGPAEGPGAQLLNWSPGAVRATVGSGGIGILVLATSSLDVLFRIKTPFWAAFAVSLLPMLIFFFAVPDLLPRRLIRPAQWVASVWYIIFAALSISLAASRGFAGVDYLLAGFILLGAWPCLVALRRLRLVPGD